MKKYYIGMDGGGTSTTLLVRRGGKEIFRMRAGSLNYNAVEEAALEKTLTQMRNELRENGFDEADCAGIGVGCAGVSNPAVRPFLEGTLLKLGYRCSVSVFGDEEAAMFGALGENDGILLISGTGSVCLGQLRKGTVRYRAGGFGHLIDDEGSAYALGRDILRAVVRAEDGRGNPTVLRKAVFEQLQIADISELVGYVYAAGRTKKEIAALAVLLDMPKVRKDDAAKQIMEKAVEALEELAVTVAGNMKADGSEGDLTMVLHGSVLKKNDWIRDRLTAGLQIRYPEIRLTEGIGDAAEGAARIAEQK